MTTATNTELLSPEERNWTIDSYLECDQEVHNGYFNEEATKVWLETLDDDELIEEAIAFMPGFLDDLEDMFETRLTPIFL